MPQPFQSAVITNDGANLLTRAQSGEVSIEFTRIAIGDGSYTETEKEVPALQAQSVLKSEKNSYPLSNIEIHNEHSVKVTALLTNQDPDTQETRVTAGYFINEMGLFAKVKDGDSDTEILYSIAVTAGETGDFMPPYNGQYPAQIIQEYYATVNNSAEVIIQSNNGAVALADDLQKFFPKLNLDTEGYSYPSNCIYKQGLDLNEVSESGLYFCSNPVNAPNGNGNGFMIAITYAGKTRGMQIYMPVSENMIYKRQNTNGSWGNWEKIKAGSAETAISKNGDTIPGRLKFINDGDVRFVPPDVTGDHARGIMFMDKNGTDIWGGIGVLGRAGTPQYIYVGAGTASPWASSQGLYISNASILWKGANLVTENSGTATAATKATQDGNGNNIVDTYAKKSIYDDTTVSLGRKSGTTVGTQSAAVGGKNNIASGECSATVGGNFNEASNLNSATVGGIFNAASGPSSATVGGTDNTASSNYSVVIGGTDNTASGMDSAVIGGWGLSAKESYSVALGRHNAHMATGTAFVIGNGPGNSQLSNAFSVMFNGVVKAKSTITGSTTADYAEFFEWMDGNPNNEDRVGRFVTLVGNKIAIASSNTDYILGIVSGEPFVLGNGDCDTWNGMYMKDDFNRTIYEPAPKMELDKETGEMVSVIDEKGNLVYEGTRPKLNHKYDPDQPYISRFDRKEWAPVGMLGVLSVIDDGSCQVDGFCRCSTDGIATACEKETEGACRVIERVSENVVRVVLK